MARKVKKTARKKPVQKSVMAPSRAKPKIGRPSGFDERYVKQAYNLMLLGLKTDQELGKALCVSNDTIFEWKKKHPAFAEAIKNGGILADAEVAAALKGRANGTIDGERVFYDPKIGEVIRARTKLAPDPVSAFFWLKNRQPELWRDRYDHTTNGESFNAFTSGMTAAGQELESKLRTNSSGNGTDH